MTTPGDDNLLLSYLITEHHMIFWVMFLVIILAFEGK